MITNEPFNPKDGEKLLVVQRTPTQTLYGRITAGKGNVTMDVGQANLFSVEEIHLYVGLFKGDNLSFERLDKHMDTVYVVKLKDGLGMPRLLSYRKWMPKDYPLPDGYFRDPDQADEYLDKMKVNLLVFYQNQIMGMRHIKVVR